MIVTNEKNVFYKNFKYKGIAEDRKTRELYWAGGLPIYESNLGLVLLDDIYWVDGFEYNANLHHIFPETLCRFAAVVNGIEFYEHDIVGEDLSIRWNDETCTFEFYFISTKESAEGSYNWYEKDSILKQNFGNIFDNLINISKTKTDLELKNKINEIVCKHFPEKEIDIIEKRVNIVKEIEEKSIEGCVKFLYDLRYLIFDIKYKLKNNESLNYLSGIQERLFNCMDDLRELRINYFFKETFNK